MSEGHFQCVHTIRFSEPRKVGSLKTDRVNGPLQEGEGAEKSPPLHNSAFWHLTTMKLGIIRL